MGKRERRRLEDGHEVGVVVYYAAGVNDGRSEIVRDGGGSIVDSEINGTVGLYLTSVATIVHPTS
jgi:hypothetical protein